MYERWSLPPSLEIIVDGSHGCMSRGLVVRLCDYYTSNLHTAQSKHASYLEKGLLTVPGSVSGTENHRAVTEAWLLDVQLRFELLFSPSHTPSCLPRRFPVARDWLSRATEHRKMSPAPASCIAPTTGCQGVRLRSSPAVGA